MMEEVRGSGSGSGGVAMVVVVVWWWCGWWWWWIQIQMLSFFLREIDPKTKANLT
jgi:hypothetical protein